MKSEILVLQTSVESFTNDLVISAQEGLEWGSTIGIALTASMLAIALIHFVFYRD